jgi:hypothetical protein
MSFVVHYVTPPQTQITLHVEPVFYAGKGIQGIRIRPAPNAKGAADDDGLNDGVPF